MVFFLAKPKRSVEFDGIIKFYEEQRLEKVCGDVCAGMVGGIECERCVGVEDGIKRHCKQEIREKGVM